VWWPWGVSLLERSAAWVVGGYGRGGGGLRARGFVGGVWGGGGVGGGGVVGGVGWLVVCFCLVFL